MTLTQQVEEDFARFVCKEPPCDFEKQLLTEHSDRVIAVLQGKLIPPYELEIQPSGKCNLACDHCFGRFYPPLEDKMHAQELRKIAQRVNEFRENGFKIETIKFCGTTGEPLVNPETVHALPFFQDKKTILFTNGLLLDKQSQGKPYYEYLADLDKLIVSLDCASERTLEQLKGARGFRRIINSLESLISQRTTKPHIMISYVIGKTNYHEVLEAAKLARELGVNEIRYRVDFTDLKGVREKSDEILEQLEKAKQLATRELKVVSVYSEQEIAETNNIFRAQGRKCFNHHFWASIGPDCNLYACGHRTHGNVQSYGSVLDNPLKDLWLSVQRKQSICQLPDNNCKVCSPSSIRRNDLMTYLDSVPLEHALD